jgi:hypothetical protein
VEEASSVASLVVESECGSRDATIAPRGSDQLCCPHKKTELFELLITSLAHLSVQTFWRQQSSSQQWTNDLYPCLHNDSRNLCMNVPRG